ncbi:hypothetical protein BDA96_02G283500 [Sorghum bicolor]|uniref:Uncharacterized protein n=2 Tax=Sorghum bicolor TaxID=4558 RepID=A0A921RQY3_SORBI|nr:hypothetical protein BDA96_02G283500 [Sorghum bicolor]OQU89796.1 hypothetical protein SORBI_3002G269800 [Sorghum bicolor]
MEMDWLGRRHLSQPGYEITRATGVTTVFSLPWSRNHVPRRPRRLRLAARDPGGFPVVSAWRKAPRIIFTRRQSEPGFDGETCPASSHRAAFPTFPADSTRLSSRLTTRFSFVAAAPPSPRLSSVAAPPPSPRLSSCHPHLHPLPNRRRPRLYIGRVRSLERHDHRSC